MEGDRTVAVVGATGRQGGAVARHLLRDGWRVRALTRQPAGSAARALAALGAAVIHCELSDQRAIVAAFEGVHGVFNVQNPMIGGVEAEIEHGRNVAEAAKRTGVRHLVYGSAGIGAVATGVGSWESKRVVQAHLEAADLQLTVLRPMAFMELMTDKGFYPAASTWHLMPKLMGTDRPIPWICVDDLGAIAARAFAEPERFIGQDIKVAADLRSLAECREIWREVYGRPPRRFPMPVWAFERFVGTDLTTMWRWLRTGHLDVDPSLTREILPSALTVREWLARQAT